MLLGMNVSPAYVPVLAAAGHQCSHWAEIGAVTAPDVEIASYAREHGLHNHNARSGFWNAPCALACSRS
ncbi:MAG: DUF5615 family PIN-like protein [Candidatus Sumerlaeaceae bacterium]